MVSTWLWLVVILAEVVVLFLVSIPLLVLVWRKIKLERDRQESLTSEIYNGLTGPGGIFREGSYYDFSATIKGKGYVAWNIIVEHAPEIINATVTVRWATPRLPYDRITVEMPGVKERNYGISSTIRMVNELAEALYPTKITK